MAKWKTSEIVDEIGEAQADYLPQYRFMNLYVMLVCGLILLCIGAYLIYDNKYLNGPALTPRDIGRTKTVTGPGALLLGAIICIFPTYQLIKQKKQKK